jgi:lipid-A-disaccharide synthase
MTGNNIIYVTAGEESGDMLGSEVIKEIRKVNPDIIIKGIGGKKMVSEGLIPVFRTEKLGFMGFIELFKHVIVIKRAFKSVLKSIITDKPSVVLMIDFSEFHIKLAKRIKSEMPETKIIKYVSPQIWASRASRINDIVKYYDCLCCILPFEKKIFAAHAIDCRYVGHPLLDRYNLKLSYDEFLEEFGIDADKTLISVFPGSRKQEISKHMPVLLDFFVKISKRNDVEILICRSANLKKFVFERYLLPENIKILDSEYQWEIMSYSGIVLCKSGTATLQTAIAGTPSVVFYKVNPISYFIAKMIVKTKFISLPNIIADKQINPELIQSDFTPDNLIAEVTKLLEKEDTYNLRKNELAEVKNLLGEKGASLKVAAAVLDYI